VDIRDEAGRLKISPDPYSAIAAVLVDGEIPEILIRVAVRRICTTSTRYRGWSSYRRLSSTMAGYRRRGPHQWVWIHS